MRNLIMTLLLVHAVCAGIEASPATTALDGINPMDAPFNAVCDGIANDAPAFSAAIDAMIAAGGKRTMSLPEGRTCKIASPISKNLNNTNDLLFLGSGSGAILLLATGNQTALRFESAHSIAFRNVTFAGTPRLPGDPNYATPDANIGLSFRAVWHLLFDSCQFYGTFTPAGMIDVMHTVLEFTNNKVRGSATSSGGSFGAIYLHQWMGGVVRNNTFLDWGYLNGTYHSKTPISTTVAWVMADEPWQELITEVVGTTPSGSNAYSQGALVVTDNYFDEGALHAVHVQSNVGIGQPPTARVHIARNNTNAPSVAGTVGYYFQNARDLYIEQVYVGYAYSQDVPGLHLQNVAHATVKGSFFVQRAATIVTRGQGELILEDTTYKALDTDGATTIRLLQKGKRIKRTPALGTHPYDDLTAIASNVESVYGSPVPTALELQPTGNVFQVVGPGTIQSLNGSGIESGTPFTLIFGEGKPYVTGSSNLKIGSPFTAQSGDTLSLMYAEGVFYETGRTSKSRKFL